MIQKVFAGVIGAGLLLAAQPAAAKVVTLTFFGSVESGADDRAVFGGGNLAGQDFTARFVFDTAAAGRETTGAHDRIDGGIEVSLPSFLDASLEINGLSWDFPGGYIETVVLTDDLISVTSADGNVVAPPEFLPFVDAGANQIALSLFSQINVFNLDLNGAWDATDSVGHFQISAFDGGVGDYVRSYGVLTARRATLDDGTGLGSVVPEPGAWALMILGFGAVGATLRRRRDAAVPA